jgi:methionyl-tRNA formyltransferase
MKIIIATIKSWNIENAMRFKADNPKIDVKIITEKSEFTEAVVRDINPDYVFIPHWSWIIPPEIYENYRCVVFHETDLPFGRGGSPIQNLIVRRIYNTKISAISVNGEIDGGDIYLKADIDISTGTISDILKRSSDIIFSEMIPRIMSENIQPHKQSGEITLFKRRKPEDSEIPKGLSDRQVYDYIRMLDGEGYPKAFIKHGSEKIVFSQAEIKDNKLTAKAEWIENE